MKTFQDVLDNNPKLKKAWAKAEIKAAKKANADFDSEEAKMRAVVKSRMEIGHRLENAYLIGRTDSYNEIVATYKKEQEEKAKLEKHQFIPQLKRNYWNK